MADNHTYDLYLGNNLTDTALSVTFILNHGPYYEITVPGNGCTPVTVTNAPDTITLTAEPSDDDTGPPRKVRFDNEAPCHQPRKCCTGSYTTGPDKWTVTIHYDSNYNCDGPPSSGDPLPAQTPVTITDKQ
ncbi:MAG: hypothetical protein GY940_04275 [bacterium]|nr:hypothetical protein [bacterium]